MGCCRRLQFGLRRNGPRCEPHLCGHSWAKPYISTTCHPSMEQILPINGRGTLQECRLEWSLLQTIHYAKRLLRLIGFAQVSLHLVAGIA